MWFVGRVVGKQLLNRAAKKRFPGGKYQRPGRVQALMRLPTLLRLGVALLKDSRVPTWQKSAVIGALGLILSPVDIVSAVPVVGQFWDFTLAVVVLDMFIKTAPAAVVNEHIIALKLQKKIPLRDL